MTADQKQRWFHSSRRNAKHQRHRRPGQKDHHRLPDQTPSRSAI